MAKKGKTPVHFSSADYYKFTVRAIQLLPVFDRLQIAALGKVSYGSVSRIISEMCNEGYLEVAGTKSSYNISKLKNNADFNGYTFSYSNSNVRSPTQYRKTKLFSKFVSRWSSFLRNEGRKR